MTDAAFPCLVAPLSDAHVAALLEQDKGDAAKASSAVRDSFQNFAAGLGLGTDTIASASSYGFNPITRNRVLLEWIHRGNWLGGLAARELTITGRAGRRCLASWGPRCRPGARMMRRSIRPRRA